MTTSHGRVSYENLQDGTRSLAEYAEILLRRKWILVAATVAAAVVVLIISLAAERKYEATANVLLNRQAASSSVIGVADPQPVEDPERVARTQAELARSPAVALRVVRASGGGSLDVTTFLDRSSVSTVANTDLLAFRVEATSKPEAIRLTNAYAREFVGYSGTVDRAALEAAARVLRAQLQQLRAAGSTGTPRYADLVSRLDIVEARLALPSNRVVLVRPAQEAKLSSPRILRNLLLGVVFGLVAGVGIAVARESFDKSVRSEAEVVGSLGVPLLARIPRSRSRGDNELRPVDETEAVIEAESYRMLRANLSLGNREEAPKAILVTSAVPGEGKSTTVANLGVALARAGHDVVLVDLDLRNPALAAVFGLQGRPGVVDVMRGDSDPARALAEVTVDGAGAVTLARRTRKSAPSRRKRRSDPTPTVLRVLPAGATPVDPGELVESNAAKELLADLRGRGEVLLIDSPPLLVVGDTVALSQNVDAVLLVARPGLLHRDDLEDLARALDGLPAELLGLVSVGVDGPVREGYYGRSVAAPPRRRRPSLGDQLSRLFPERALEPPLSRTERRAPTTSEPKTKIEASPPRPRARRRAAAAPDMPVREVTGLSQPAPARDEPGAARGEPAPARDLPPEPRPVSSTSDLRRATVRRPPAAPSRLSRADRKWPALPGQMTESDTEDRGADDG